MVADLFKKRQTLGCRLSGFGNPLLRMRDTGQPPESRCGFFLISFVRGSLQCCAFHKAGLGPLPFLPGQEEVALGQQVASQQGPVIHLPGQLQTFAQGGFGLLLAP